MPDIRILNHFLAFIKVMFYPNCLFNLHENSHLGVPIVAQWLTNPTRNHEVAGSVPGLAQWVKDPALP